MSLLKTPALTSLYRQFVVSTSRSRAPIYTEHLNQEPQPSFDLIRDKVYDKAQKDKEETNPLFKQFCEEAE